MITTLQQYEVAKRQANAFRDAIAAWEPTPPEGVSLVIHEATKASLENQLHDLLPELEVFEFNHLGISP